MQVQRYPSYQYDWFAGWWLVWAVSTTENRSRPSGKIAKNTDDRAGANLGTDPPKTGSPLNLGMDVMSIAPCWFAPDPRALSSRPAIPNTGRKWCCRPDEGTLFKRRRRRIFHPLRIHSKSGEAAGLNLSSGQRIFAVP
jgi:hypothetical protein